MTQSDCKRCEKAKDVDYKVCLNPECEVGYYNILEINPTNLPDLNPLEVAMHRNYELGQIVAKEEFVDELLKLAGGAYAASDDARAKWLRSLAHRIRSEVAPERAAYMKNYHKT